MLKKSIGQSAKTVNGATTHYLVDDLNPTGLPQVVEETDATQRIYTYGLQRISEYQVINSAWTPSFYGYDGMGSVRQLTNTAGATTDTYEYDAFGNELNSTGTTPNEFLYRGEQYDSDLSLYYLRARYYNPLTGRLLSRDPEDGNPYVPGSLHKYLYAGGDPINASDPTGRVEIVEYSQNNRRAGFQLHHIVEQRFGRLFGGAVCSLSAALTVVEHQAITNAWRRAIPYGVLGTGLATIDQVFDVAEQIYADSPEMAAALERCKVLAGL